MGLGQKKNAGPTKSKTDSYLGLKQGSHHSVKEIE